MPTTTPNSGAPTPVSAPAAAQPKYRPAPPKPAAAAKKNTGMMAGLGVSAALALVGLGLAGWLWSGKSAMQSKLTQHETAANGLAATLGVALSADTNTPIDWTTAWAALDQKAAEQKRDLATATEKAAGLEQQVTESQTALTELQNTAQTAAEKLKTSTAEINALKTQADQATADLAKAKAEMEAIQKERDEKIGQLQDQLEAASATAAHVTAATDAAPAPEKADAVTDAVATETAAASETAPAVAGAPGSLAEPAAAAAVAAAAAAAPGSLAAPDAEGEAHEDIERAPAGIQHNYAEGTTKLIKGFNYTGSSQALRVVLMNGDTLDYTSVPEGLASAMANAPVPDVFFRLKVLGNFPCTVDDTAVVREANKSE